MYIHQNPSTLGLTPAGQTWTAPFYPRSIKEDFKLRFGRLGRLRKADTNALGNAIVSAWEAGNVKEAMKLQPLLLKRPALAQSDFALAIGMHNAAANKPAEALPFLELAFATGSGRSAEFLQALAYSYLRNSSPSAALTTLYAAKEQELLSGRDLAILYNEIGNVHLVYATWESEPTKFSDERKLAELAYSKAVTFDPTNTIASQNLRASKVITFEPTYGALDDFLPPLKIGQATPVKNALIAALKAEETYTFWRRQPATMVINGSEQATLRSVSSLHTRPENTEAIDQLRAVP